MHRQLRRTCHYTVKQFKKWYVSSEVAISMHPLNSEFINCSQLKFIAIILFLQVFLMQFFVLPIFCLTISLFVLKHGITGKARSALSRWTALLDLFESLCKYLTKYILFAEITEETKIHGVRGSFWRVKLTLPRAHLDSIYSYFIQ